MSHVLTLLLLVYSAGLGQHPISDFDPAVGTTCSCGVLSSYSINEDDSTQIRSLIQMQQSAWNAGDLEKFMQPYWNSPKLTFSSGGQTTRGWQATLDRYRKKYSSKDLMGQLEFSNLEIDLLSDQSALVLGQWKLVRAADQPHGNFTLVLKKMGQGWKIVHDHSSLFEEPESNSNDDLPLPQ